MTGATRALLITGAVVFLWFALDLILLLFAAILFGILVRTLACWASDQLGISIGWSMTAVLLLLVGAFVGFGFLYAPALAEQTDQLTQTLPQAFAELTAWMRQYAWGTWLLDQISGGEPSGEQVVNHARRVAGSIANGMVGAAVILFAGIYLAADPRPYVRGLLRLVPQERRQRVAEVMFAIAYTLRWWLVGQALAMVLVGLAMGIGLAVIGVPLALALGVVAGLLEFVPLLGPLLALGPALLLAGAESTRDALWVLVLYGVVQSAESYVITPLVQRKAVHLPPVTTITAQVALSWAAGALGLLLAVPLAAATLVAIQMLYVQDRLNSAMHVAAAEIAAEEVAAATYLRDLLGGKP